MYQITYEFRLRDGQTRAFSVELDEQTQSILPNYPDVLPEWTYLEHCQCPNCPLSPAEESYCPIAAKLVHVIDFFRNVISYTEAEVWVCTPRRWYCHPATDVAAAVSSLLGLHMAASGCPVMDCMRPLVFTHLPFANREETIFRSLSSYLLAQFFRARHGQEPDWSLQGLVELYAGVNQVNHSFSERLRTVCEGDASLNALMKLSCFASLASDSLESDSLAEIEGLFSAYLQS